MSDLRKRLNAAYENGMFNADWDDLDGVCALLLEAESRLAQLESVLAEAKRECIMTPFCAAKIVATDAAQENGK